MKQSKEGSKSMRSLPLVRPKMDHMEHHITLKEKHFKLQPYDIYVLQIYKQ